MSIISVFFFKLTLIFNEGRVFAQLINYLDAFERSAFMSIKKPGSLINRLLGYYLRPLACCLPKQDAVCQLSSGRFIGLISDCMFNSSKICERPNRNS